MYGGAVGKVGALYCLFHPVTGIRLHPARRSERSQYKAWFWEHNESTSLPALCHSSVGNGAPWIQGGLTLQDCFCMGIPFCMS